MAGFLAALVAASPACSGISPTSGRDTEAVHTPTAITGETRTDVGESDSKPAPTQTLAKVPTAVPASAIAATPTVITMVVTEPTSTPAPTQTLANVPTAVPTSATAATPTVATMVVAEPTSTPALAPTPTQRATPTYAAAPTPSPSPTSATDPCPLPAPTDGPVAGAQGQFSFVENDIVDGLLAASYRAGKPDDFRSIISDTGVDIVSVNTSVSPTRQAQYVARQFANNDTVRIIQTSDDIDSALKDCVLGVVFLLQRAWPFEASQTPHQAVEEWFQSGVRIAQLGYSQAYEPARPYVRYFGDYESELTDLGREVVGALLDHDILLDVSHTLMPASLEIIEIARKRGRPVTANHANARALHNHPRNKSDTEICGIAQSGGAIGITPIRSLVTWDDQATTEQLVEHINYIVNLDCTNDQGNSIEMINHVSVATDADVDGWDPNGETGRRVYFNQEMNSPDRWMALASVLASPPNSYSADDLAKVFGGNLLRVYRAVFPG